jgi:hypothetical protein
MNAQNPRRKKEMKLTTEGVRFATLMHPRTVRQLKILAIDKRISTSEIMRRAVADYLAREKSSNRPVEKSVG